MQIYDALKNDHDKVKELLDELIALPDMDKSRRSRLISQIRDELIPHSRAEEAVFYNSIRTMKSDTAHVWHGYKEHLEAEALLRTLQSKDSLGGDWRSTAFKLKEALEHHIEEEETDLFFAARQVLSPQEAEQMGTAFKRMKPEIREEGLLGTTVDLIANMMPPRFTKSFRSYKTPSA